MKAQTIFSIALISIMSFISGTMIYHEWYMLGSFMGMMSFVGVLLYFEIKETNSEPEVTYPKRSRRSTYFAKNTHIETVKYKQKLKV